MKRETRLNLIFLAVFLVISLPGAVILFIKKLDPAAPRMDEPDAVLRQIPFMVPPPAPPGARWMVPPATRAWLDDLTRQKAGTPMASAVVGGPEWEPIISADHLLQVMSVAPTQDATMAGLLLWDGSASADASKYRLQVHIRPVRDVSGGPASIPSPGTPGEGQGGGLRDERPTDDHPLPNPPPAYRGREKKPRNENGAIESIEPVPVPPDVRKELVSLGYTHPPTQVLWLRARWPGALTAGEVIHLDLTGSGNPPLRTGVEWAVK